MTDNKSEGLANLAGALKKFHALMSHVKADKKGEKSNYVTYEALHEAVTPLFQELGLCHTHTVEPHGEGFVMRTRLLWSSADGICEWIDSVMPILSSGRVNSSGKSILSPMQDFTSACTTAKRISLSMICGLREEKQDVSARPEADAPLPWLTLEHFMKNKDVWFAGWKEKGLSDDEILVALGRKFRFGNSLADGILREYGFFKQPDFTPVPDPDIPDKTIVH